MELSITFLKVLSFCLDQTNLSTTASRENILEKILSGHYAAVTAAAVSTCDFEVEMANRMCSVSFLILAAFM